MNFKTSKVFNDSQFQLAPAINNLIFYNEIDIFPGIVFQNNYNAIKKIVQETKQYELLFCNKRAVVQIMMFMLAFSLLMRR